MRSNHLAFLQSSSYADKVLEYLEEMPAKLSAREKARIRRIRDDIVVLSGYDPERSCERSSRRYGPGRMRLDRVIHTEALRESLEIFDGEKRDGVRTYSRILEEIDETLTRGRGKLPLTKKFFDYYATRTLMRNRQVMTGMINPDNYVLSRIRTALEEVSTL